MKRILVALTVLVLLTACGSHPPELVHPVATIEPCSGIDEFQALLRNTGITYDYEPSDSLDELAGWADAVVVGTLTGVGEARQNLAGEGMGTAAFTIQVDRVLQQRSGPEIGESLMVVSDFNPSVRSIADYEKVLPNGARTVGFLSQWKDAWGLYLEGFWFACDDDDPPGNGLVEAGWKVESLASLIEAVEEDPEIKPEPSPTTTEFDSEPVGDHKIRVWPRSAEVADEGTYRFTVPHCGLDSMVDFDGSFWEAKHPDDYGKGNRYPFFYNSDVGTFTFVSSDAAIYEASTGEEISLLRLEGPIVTGLCM